MERLGKTRRKDFPRVKTVIDREIGRFANWNQFCFALLLECHEHYYPPSLRGWMGCTTETYAVISSATWALTLTALTPVEIFLRALPNKSRNARAEQKETA